MRLKYTFKHMNSSEALVEHTRKQLEHMERYELKPYDFHFCFSKIRHERKCEVLITGPDVRIRAEAKSSDIYAALDFVLEKMERQLGRHKEKVQHHKKRKDPVFVGEREESDGESPLESARAETRRQTG